MAEVDNTKQFQAIGSWQVGVDASSNASTRLVLDKTPGISLKALIDSLDISGSAGICSIRINNTTYTLTPDSTPVVPTLITDVTVDGQTAITNSVGVSSLQLDAVRSVSTPIPDAYTGSVALTDIDVGGGTGKKLLVKFPLSEKTENLQEVVFSQTRTIPATPGLGSGNAGDTIVPVFPDTVNQFVNADYPSVYDEATGELVIQAGQDGYYSALVNIVANDNGDTGSTATPNFNFGLAVEPTGSPPTSSYYATSEVIGTTLIGGTAFVAPIYLEEGAKIYPYFYYVNGKSGMFVHQMSLSLYRIRGV
jgi:hypothetical protein